MQWLNIIRLNKVCKYKGYRGKAHKAMDESLCINRFMALEVTYRMGGTYRLLFKLSKYYCFTKGEFRLK